MWRPPERIRHRLPATQWPTESEAETALLFRPIRVGPLELRQRSWVPAMVPWRASADGFVTDAVLQWYERLARGRPGALVVEATGVRDVPSGPLLRIGNDRFVPGLQRLVSTVAEASRGETTLFIQILDFLAIKRRPTKENYLRRFLGVRPEHRHRLNEAGGKDHWTAASEDEVRQRLLASTDEELEQILDERELEDLKFGVRERVNDLHRDHVRDLPRTLPDIFAAAAERARTAGFSGVELHFAHAYTMASFLSALNVRNDGYGGSRENRLRLPLEVYRAVRARVGASWVVGCRMLGDEVVDGGTRLDDAAFYAVELAKAGVDYISLSKGGKFEDAKQPEPGAAAYPYTGRSGYECMPTVYSDAKGPFGRNVPLAARIREDLRRAGLATPVVTSGGVGTFEQAEAILRNGDADIVAAARQALADPDWLRKIRLGRGAEIRRCEFTNYCEALDQKHKEVTCKLWDRTALDAPGVALDSSGKRRLVAPDWR